MLNKSHESKLSAFGLDKTIDRWNRVYYVYPNAILTALRNGNPNMFNEANQKGQAPRTNYAATAALGPNNNQNSYPADSVSQSGESLINEAAGRVVSQMSMTPREQPPFAEIPISLPVDQAELIKNAQADVEAAHNWVPEQSSTSTSGQFPIAQQFTADQSSVEIAAPLTETEIEQQKLIRYAQQGVQEAHDWLAGQSTTEPRL